MSSETVEVPKEEFEAMKERLQKLEAKKGSSETSGNPVEQGVEIVKNIAKNFGLAPSETLEALSKRWTEGYCRTVSTEFFSNENIKSVCSAEEKLSNLAVEADLNYEDYLNRVEDAL